MKRRLTTLVALGLLLGACTGGGGYYGGYGVESTSRPAVERDPVTGYIIRYDGILTDNTGEIKIRATCRMWGGLRTYTCKRAIALDATGNAQSAQDWGEVQFDRASNRARQWCARNQGCRQRYQQWQRSRR